MYSKTCCKELHCGVQILPTTSASALRKIRDSGALPQQNYILKFVDHHGIGLLGDVELRYVHRFWLAHSSFVLQKCVCRTRQSFFSSAVYLID